MDAETRALDKKIAVSIMGVTLDLLVATCHPYTTSVECDYMVLEKVRRDWEGAKLQVFLGTLCMIYGERTDNPALFFLQYRAGDYSRAALRTLELVK